jgi:hypothetical protein
MEQWLKNPAILFIYYSIFIFTAFTLLPKLSASLLIKGNILLISLFMALVLTSLHHYVFNKNK